MKQTLDEIAELASDIGSMYLLKGQVNLKKIAAKNHIDFINGHYGNHFLGELIHYQNKFYIILNEDLLSNSEAGRVRFTIAHELGHFFIDNHRNKLSKGISLSFKGELSTDASKQIEQEANLFASHLLMPKEAFIKIARRKEPGMERILVLKETFDTSIYSTIKHYIHLNLSNCIMLKWNSDLSFHYGQYSDPFSKLTGIKGRPPVKYDSNYIQQQIDLINETGDPYVEQATPISKWIHTITPGSAKDIMGIEQTIKLGDYGAITLLLFNQ